LGGIPFTSQKTVILKIKTDETRLRLLGKDAVIKNFYEGPGSAPPGITNWVENMPTQVPETAQEKYDRAAIQIF
jgi:hypothetical protein